MKKIIATLLMAAGCWTSLPAQEKNDYDFKEGQWFYRILPPSKYDNYYIQSKDLLYAQIVGCDEGVGGDITFPATVEHEGQTYHINWIGDNEGYHMRYYLNDNVNTFNKPVDPELQGYKKTDSTWTSFESVTIPEGIVGLTRAFTQCSTLKKVSLPKSLINIGQYSFFGTQLDTLVVPADKVYVQLGSFYGLKHVKVKDLGVSGNMFSRTEEDLESNLYYIFCDEKWGATTETIDITDSPRFMTHDGAVYSKKDSTLLYLPHPKIEYEMPPFAKGFNRIADTNHYPYCRNENARKLKKLRLSENMEDYTRNDPRYSLNRFPFLDSITTPPNCKNYIAVDNLLYSKNDSTLLFVPQEGGVFKPADFTKSLGGYTIHYTITSFTIPKCLQKWENENIMSEISKLARYGRSLDTFEAASDCENYMVIDNVVYSKDTADVYAYPYSHEEITIDKHAKRLAFGNFYGKVKYITSYATEPPVEMHAPESWRVYNNTYLVDEYGRRKYNYNVISFVPDESIEKYQAVIIHGGTWIPLWGTCYPLSQRENIISGIFPAARQDTPTVIHRYNADGVEVNEPVKGLNILKMSDGTTRKIIIK